MTMLIASKAGDYGAALQLSQAAADLTPALAMQNPQQLSGLKRENEGNYLKLISLLLMRVMELLNVTNTLSAAQLADLAVRIGKKYYYLRLEELVYVFQQAQNGAYGKDYNRLDSTIIMEWIDRYDVDERTPLVVSVATAGVKPLTVANVPAAELQTFVDRVRPHEGLLVDDLSDADRREAEAMAEVQQLYDRVSRGEFTPPDASAQRGQERKRLLDEDYNKYRAEYAAQKSLKQPDPETANESTIQDAD